MEVVSQPWWWLTWTKGSRYVSYVLVVRFCRLRNAPLLPHIHHRILSRWKMPLLACCHAHACVEGLCRTTSEFGRDPAFLDWRERKKTESAKQRERKWTGGFPRATNWVCCQSQASCIEVTPDSLGGGSFDRHLATDAFTNMTSWDQPAHPQQHVMACCRLDSHTRRLPTFLNTTEGSQQRPACSHKRNQCIYLHSH